MNIKEKIIELLNADLGIQTYRIIEKLSCIMFKDYLNSQSKRISMLYNIGNIYWDMVFPDGIDDIKGKIAVDIKVYKNKFTSFRTIQDTLGRYALNRGEFDKLLLIIVNESQDRMTARFEDIKNQLDFELIVWNLDDLVRIFSHNEKLFEEAYKNPDAVLFKDTISEGVSRDKETYIEKRKEYIKQLHEKYEDDKLALFLGAGASKDAKIAMWDELISKLFVALIDKELSEKGIKIENKDRKKIIKSVTAHNDSSPLMQTRFLRNSFDNDFVKLVREILYEDAVETSSLLEEIGKLCIPNRGKYGVRAIVNYNFDDLVEKNLQRFGVKYHSIYSEGMIPEADELGIYHVHGFLPRDKENYNNLSKSLLVFSEEGYHKLMLEPYHWANLTQLNYMMNNTCLFIGLSMTDPNMRRLLEIAAQKRMENDQDCPHYAIMRRFKMKESDKVESLKSFENVHESLQESFFKESGINVIWVDEFSEIPEIIKEIKGN